VGDGWCWFVLREKYCWLVAGGWFVVREKYCCLVADKPTEPADFCVVADVSVVAIGGASRILVGGLLRGRLRRSELADEKLMPILFNFYCHF
jgi:hypothetical protein